MTHIPAVNNNAAASDSDMAAMPGGILLDYRLYADYYAIASPFVTNVQPQQASHNLCLSLNSIWLHTQNAPQLLAELRQTLQSSPTLQVTNLFDRRAINQQLGDDPLQTGLLALFAMSRVIYRGAVSQVLRLNED